jgi:DNA-directed RNA polymerase omega subunit
MNNEYLLRAKEVIPDAKVLIVLASKRAAMLASGKSRPMVRPKNSDKDSYLDIALLEIAEGKLEAEFGKEGDNDILNELEALKKASQAELEPLKKTPGE